MRSARSANACGPYFEVKGLRGGRPLTRQRSRARWKARAGRSPSNRSVVHAWMPAESLFRAEPSCEVEGPRGVEPLREVEGPHAFPEADEGSITSRSALRALVWVLGLGRPLSLERIRNGDWTQCLVRA